MTEAEKRTTNIAIRASIEGIVDILGTNGAKILFKNAGLIHVFENPPGYDWNPSITIPEQASIYSEVANLLGLNGAISLWRRMGYTVLKFAVEVGHTLDAYKDLPQDEKFYKEMELFTIGSGKGRVVKNDDGSVDFDCFDCIHCAGYKTKRPMCSHYVGFIQYISDWAYGKGVYIARETKCKAMGDGTCYFQFEKIDEFTVGRVIKG